MKYVILLGILLMGCTHTVVTVVTVVAKRNSPTDKSSGDYYYEGPMEMKDVKKLLNKTLGGDESAEKPESYKD